MVEAGKEEVAVMVEVMVGVGTETRRSWSSCASGSMMMAMIMNCH